MIRLITATLLSSSIKQGFLTLQKDSFTSATSYHSCPSKMTTTLAYNYSYINSTIARMIDENLMTQPGFSIDQLMELAGLAVAISAHMYLEDIKLAKPEGKILILAGMYLYTLYNIYVI